MLDDDLIEHFRHVAEKEAAGYQTMINPTLRAAMSGAKGTKPSESPLTASVLRRILREELGEAK
jgi:hypothetical protein